MDGKIQTAGRAAKSPSSYKRNGQPGATHAVYVDAGYEQRFWVRITDFCSLVDARAMAERMLEYRDPAKVSVM